MHLTLRQLTIFAAAARRSSLTRAAEELHLTWTTVWTDLLTDLNHYKGRTFTTDPSSNRSMG